MIKDLVHQFMLLIDSGRLFKAPVKWLYTLIGVLCSLPAIVFVVLFLYYWEFFMGLIGGNFWTDFVSVFVYVLFFYGLCLFGLIGYHYWKDRRANLDHIIRTGSRIVVIPLVADINQSMGEVISIFLLLITVVAALLANLACFLTNGFGFYTEWGFLWMPMAAVAAVAVVALVAYLNMLLVRFFSERLRLLPLIGNDVHHLSVSDEKVAVADADSAESFAFHHPHISPREKKIAQYALIAAAAVALITAFCLTIGNAVAMRKSIYMPLTDTRVRKIDENRTSFAAFYDAVRERCEVQPKDTFARISYKRLYRYETNYYNNDAYIASVREKAGLAYESDVLAPVLPQCDSIASHWSAYAEQHDPARYLSITTHTGIYRETIYWSRYDHPNFYFSFSMPKGEIKDAVISYTTQNAKGRAHSNISAGTLTFSQLRKCDSESHAVCYSGIDDKAFWSRYHLVVTIKSVTLMDGTVILASDMNVVPKSVQTYLNRRCEATQTQLIRDQIDASFPIRAEYTHQQIIRDLMDKDELCFHFLKD